jgi:hypothetical protein
MYKEMYEQKDNLYVSLINEAFDSDKVPRAYPILRKEEVWLSHLDFRGGGKSNLNKIISCLKTPQCQKINLMNLSDNFLSSVTLL